MPRLTVSKFSFPRHPTQPQRQLRAPVFLNHTWVSTWLIWCMSSLRNVAMLNQQQLLHFSIVLRTECGTPSLVSHTITLPPWPLVMCQKRSIGGHFDQKFPKSWSFSHVLLLTLWCWCPISSVIGLVSHQGEVAVGGFLWFHRLFTSWCSVHRSPMQKILNQDRWHLHGWTPNSESFFWLEALVLVEDVEQVAVELVGRVALRLEHVPLLSRSRRVLFGLAVGLTSRVLPAGMPGAAFATDASA